MFNDCFENKRFTFRCAEKQCEFSDDTPVNLDAAELRQKRWLSGKT